MLSSRLPWYMDTHEETVSLEREPNAIIGPLCVVFPGP